MSNIIANAKRLLAGATPAPWEVHTYDIGGAIYGIGNIEPGYGGGDPLDCVDKDAYLAATAPELAQALAEETYFYGVQVWMGGRWIMMLTSDYGTSLMHRGKWFEHKHEAEECAAKWNHDTPTRIVRQRRSPAEVCE